MRNRAGPSGDQSGSGRRSRSSITPNCTLAPGTVEHFVQPPEQLLGLALHDRHAQVLEFLRQHAGRGADHEHAGLRLFGQQAGDDLAFQVERDQRRVEHVEIGPARRLIDNVLHAMPQPGEDCRQVGKQQGRRPAIAAVEPADDRIPRPAQPAVHAHAKAAGKIFGNVELASIPEEDVHDAGEVLGS